MKRSFLKQLSVYFFIVSVLTFSSCGSDDSISNAEDDQDEVETTDPTDPVITPDSAVFEDNFILSDDSTFINYILSEEEYNKFINREGDFTTVSNKVYEHLNDTFDFIFILSVETEQPAGLYYGLSTKAQNHVQGLGNSIYDNTAAYGSAGKLKSIIHMPLTEYIRSGPFLHEIAHYWGNHGFVSTTVGGHWGYSSVGGQLGGFNELTDMGGGNYKANVTGKTSFGTNANGANTVPYGNAELYLMGLIKADELESIKVAKNPVSTGNGTFTADAITTVTAAELIADHGARIPSEENSQKEFKGITVVLSTSPLSDEKKNSIATNLDNFSKNSAPDAWGSALNFWQATKEKATIEIAITASDVKQ